MSGRRPRPLSERLTARNSILWCELDVAAIHVRVILADRQSRSIPELHDSKQGGWDPDTGIILVGWDLPGDVAESTAFHELGHAVIFANGIKLHPDREVDEDEEEIILNALNACLHAALKRNGLLSLPPRPELPASARGAWKEPR